MVNKTPIRILSATMLGGLLGLGGTLHADEKQYITPTVLSHANSEFNNSQDALSKALPVGFNFTFGGVVYSSVYMSTNGVLYFVTPPATNDGPNMALSTTTRVGIFPFWDDLQLGPDDAHESKSQMLYYTTGEAGSRVFVAQWTNMYHYNDFSGPIGTFNVVLHETTGKVDIYFRNMSGTSTINAYGKSATIGLRTAAGAVSQYSLNAQNATEGKFLSYNPSESTYSLGTEVTVNAANTAQYETYYLSSPSSPEYPTNLSASTGTPVATSTTIGWDLAALGTVPATYEIKYGINSTLAGASTTGSFTTPNRTKVLTGLTAGTTYYYQVISSTSDGLTSVSPVASFKQAANTTPIASDGTLSMAFETGTTGTLVANDPDANTILTYSITSAPSARRGTVEITNAHTGAFTFTPADGFTGQTSFKFKATDGTAYSQEGTITVTVASSSEPTNLVLASKTDIVPGGGEGNSHIPAAAKWYSFGVPSINDQGNVAFQATLSIGQTATMAGIFAGDSVAPGLVIKKGAAAPGLTDVVVSDFKDPLLGQDGSVGFFASLANATGKTGVTLTNNQAFYLDADGSGSGAPVLVVRKGSVDADTGAKFQTITSVALGARVVAFNATLATSASTIPATTSANNSGLWIYNRTTAMTVCVLRKGDLLEENTPGSAIRVIATLPIRSGTDGHGNGVVTNANVTKDQVVVRLSLADGRQVVGFVDEDGMLTLPFVSKDHATAFSPSALWTTFGLPTQNASGALAFLGNVKDFPSVTNYSAIYGENDTRTSYARLVTQGAGAVGTAGKFSTFKDPVSAAAGSPSGCNVAFQAAMGLNATTGITSANRNGIWWIHNNSMSLIGRTGTAATGALSLTTTLPKWYMFTSLALPEGGNGPLFVGILTGTTAGVTSANNIGLWGTDSNGGVYELLREGDTFRNAKVRNFTALSSVPESSNQTRSFNSKGQVIVRVLDTNNAQSLMVIQVPTVQVVN